MKYFKFISVFFILLITATSCDINTDDVSLQPNAIGDDGELIIIISDANWSGEVGDAIRKAFKKPYPRVTTPQPYFDLRQFDSKKFTGDVKNYKNIFNVEIVDNEKYRIPVLRIQQDVWAKGQLVIRIFSQTAQGAQVYLEKNGGNLRDKIDEMLRERYMKLFQKHDNKANEALLADKFSIFTEFDDDYRIRINKENFVWFSSEVNRNVQGSGSHPVEMGVVVYSFPYQDKVQLSTKYLNAYRDSILKQNVKGENNSYMTSVYMEDFEPFGEDINLHDTYGNVVRGRYEFVGDFIAGGSFISLAIVHPSTQQVINLYGFIYAPKFDKREYIRQLEAILYSTTPIQPNENE